MESRVPSLKDLATIIYRPRQTFRRILDSGRDRWTIELVVLAFICASVTDPDIRGLLEALPGLPLHAALALIALALLCLAAMWVVVLYAVAGIATIVGRWLDGKGTAADVRAALAWGLVPVVWSIVFRIPLAVYHSRLDLRPRDRGQMLFDFVQQGGLTVFIVFATAQILMYVCILFVASNALGEALRFSSWKGLATVVISIVLPIVLVVGAVIAFQS